MGGKDTPPPSATGSSATTQTSRFECSFGGGSLPASPASSVKSAALPPSRRPPIDCVPRSNSDAGAFAMRWAPGEMTAVPRSSIDSGSYSPIRAYMDVIRPQTLKCAIVGDSGVGKTSMLMSYTVDKFPESHSPTIYDKFSSK